MTDIMTPAQRHRCMSNLRTFSHKAKTYILVDEENLPLAAEDTIEYN